MNTTQAVKTLNHLRSMETKKKKADIRPSHIRTRTELEKFYQQVVKSFGYEYQKRI
jgi:hypothetical protein